MKNVIIWLTERLAQTTAYFTKFNDIVFNLLQPFKPPWCIKASFYIPENILNFPTTKGFRTKVSMKLVFQYIVIFFNFQTTSSHFIHYKSKVAAAIRGL